MYWKAIKENNCYKTVDLLQNYRPCDKKNATLRCQILSDNVTRKNVIQTIHVKCVNTSYLI